jgi:type I restriction enzyme, S subunit
MSWQQTTLGEVADIVSGSTPKSDVPRYWDGAVAWATPTDLSRLDGKHLDKTDRTITEEGLNESSARLLPPGSVLFSSRAPIGLVAINTKPMATNQGFKSFVPRPEVNADYLYWWLRANRKQLEDLGNGATFKEVSKAVVSRVKFPLPPLTEQRRIAAILDKADAIRRKREQALALADDFLRSVFLEMFGDPASNSKGWPVGSIRDLIVDAKYGTSQKADVVEGSYPVLRMGNLTYSGRIDTTDLKYLDLKENEIAKYTVRRGDILFNRTNSRELVGKTAVFMADEVYAYAGYLVRARTNSKANPHYISAFLNSTFGKATLQGMCKSIIGMANINAQEFQNIRIPVPPFDLQNRFGGVWERTEATRQLLQADLLNAADLFAALSQRAFRGEL